MSALPHIPSDHPDLRGLPDQRDRREPPTAEPGVGPVAETVVEPEPEPEAEALAATVARPGVEAAVATVAAEPGPAPGLLWYLTEPTRTAVAIGQFAATRSLLRAAPSGDGHTVLVLPGLGATDASTATLRKFLTGLGYDVHGWGLGLNIGPSVGVVRGMRELLRELAVGGKVSIVGWSLGGIFARELAREHPGMVRQVITLGSPYAMTDLRQTRVNPVYRLLAMFYVSGADLPPPEHTRPPFPVPSTSVYSKSDGIVAWQTCISTPNARQQNVAVNSSHLGYGYNATVLWLIADRLSQRHHRWRPFTPPPGMTRMFPDA